MGERQEIVDEFTRDRGLVISELVPAARVRTVTGYWGELELAEVARACGFASANTFSRAYRARYGASPGGLRSRGEHRQS